MTFRAPGRELCVGDTDLRMTFLLHSLSHNRPTCHSLPGTDSTDCCRLQGTETFVPRCGHGGGWGVGEGGPVLLAVGK